MVRRNHDKLRCFKIFFSVLGYEKFIGNSINLGHGFLRAFSLLHLAAQKTVETKFSFWVFARGWVSVASNCTTVLIKGR